MVYVILTQTQGFDIRKDIRNGFVPQKNELKELSIKTGITSS